MKMYMLALMMLSGIIFSCNEKKESRLNEVLNTDQLTSQFFTVNISKDTSLFTKDGCIINIPAGSIVSDSTSVQLEVKEALSMEEIIRGGLTTKSGKQNLSSAGMIFINPAKGIKAGIQKKLDVYIPSRTFNPDMKIFKGVKDEKGNIDWQSPVPLPEDSTLLKIKAGENLFISKCANCHKVSADFTGPELITSINSRSKQWLNDFIRNPTKMITEGGYAYCVSDRWKPIVMTSFPELSDTALDCIYAYIKSEADKTPQFTQRGMSCCDSCEFYKEQITAINRLKNNKETLIADNENFFTFDRIPPVLNTSFNIGGELNVNDMPTRVSPVNMKATYYNINVETFGWYNIDMMIKNYQDCKESKLAVNIDDNHDINFNLCLIIPGRKVFVEGGKLDDGKQYGFDETNGKIVLPQNEQCIIVVFGQYNDKIIFGKTTFTSQLNQTVTVSTTQLSKEEMLKEFSLMQLDGIKTNVTDSKHSGEIRNTDNKIDSLMKLLPKGCNCMPPAKADSSYPERYTSK